MTHPQDVEPAGLKPCPFCGGEAEIVHIEDGENAGGSCVSCKRCQASSNVEFEFKENFVSNWNTRASSSPSGDVREAVARIIDPRRWEVLDSYLRDVQRKPNAGYDPGNFKDKASLSKADQIAALYVERIGVETASASEPVVHPGDGDGNDSTPLTHANKLRTSEEPQT